MGTRRPSSPPTETQHKKHARRRFTFNFDAIRIAAVARGVVFFLSVYFSVGRCDIFSLYAAFVWGEEPRAVHSHIDVSGAKLYGHILVWVFCGTLCVICVGLVAAFLFLARANVVTQKRDVPRKCQTPAHRTIYIVFICTIPHKVRVHFSDTSVGSDCVGVGVFVCLMQIFVPALFMRPIAFCERPA